MTYLLPAPGQTAFVAPSSDLFHIPPVCDLHRWTIDMTAQLRRAESILEYRAAVAVKWAERTIKALNRHMTSTPAVIYAHPPGCIVLDMATVNERFKPGQVYRAYRILAVDRRDSGTYVQIDISTGTQKALVWRKA